MMVSDTVSRDTVVSMNYTLTDNAGNILDASQGEPLEYLQGHQNIIPGLEKELEGLKPGERKKVTVQPEEGYGRHNPELIFSLPLEQFGGQAPQTGMVVQLQSPEGAMMATIVKVENQQVTLDANHPLAGQVLNFDVEIVGIRSASTEELSHGHPHGPDGHHH
ncbi:MAG: peptidylprolyl isomerase [Vampirovibrio sp.]|jgi:FKBP-type peptidyl-prolyl cis-trans isomerase SlyD|nr:peptidylprolyl isomerase [Vampirovibrio sp.]